MSRRLIAATAAAALATTLSVAAGSAATADDGSGVPPITRPHIATSAQGKVSPALEKASGPVTAFVELDATSGVDTAQAGGSPAAVEAAADKVEQLAAEVVPDAPASSDAPQTISVTTDLVSGVVVRGDAAEVRALAAKPGVTSVRLVTPRTPTNKGTDVFTKAVQAWQSTGLTGQGVRIGVIDTGLDYTHADFGGPGTAEAYEQAFGTDGTQPVPAGTYDPIKFLGGYDFAGHLYDADSTDPAVYTPVPDPNPIDSPGGHGTHVAGTAAGFGVAADGATFRGDYTNPANLADLSTWKVGPGTAPQAGVYALKVFGDVAGTTNLTLGALEWAADPNGDKDYSDHLDIVNMSLGADYMPADDPENDFVDQLAKIGVLSVVASGNASDVVDIGGSPGNARSALTVANSVSDAQVLDGVEVTEAPAGVTPGVFAAQNTIAYAGPDVTAPVVFLGDTVDGCTSLAPYAEQIAGKIVWLWWDDNDATRACGSGARWNNVAAAGAAGGIVGWSQPVFSYGLTGSAAVPGAMLTADATAALLPAIKAGGVTMRIGPGLANASFVSTASSADTLNPGSSRGVHGSIGIVKPDVAAPGTSISSANAGSGTEPTTMSGTSMATPHVAGITALVRQAHPTWTALQVKAAVMNTATHDVYTGQDRTGAVYGPERVGSGRVDAADATTDQVLAYATDDPALVSVTFGVVPVGPKPLALKKTVTVTNLGKKSARYSTSFAKSSGAGGASITVSPSSITVPAGGSKTVTVTLKADPATLAKEIDPTSATEAQGLPREFVTSISGRLVLTSPSGQTLRVPVQAAPRLVSSVSAADKVILDGTGTTTVPLSGTGVQSGGWRSIVSPLVLAATSDVLGDDAPVGVARSIVDQGDLRYVGYASSAPQLAAAGGNPAEGYLTIGIATQGEWTSLGSTVYPVIDIDVDGDSVPEFETIVWKIADETDLTVAQTFTVVDGALGEVVDLEFVNGIPSNVETTVFDNNVLLAPVWLGALGLEPGQTPTFTVQTVSPAVPGSLIDLATPFSFDPYAPAYWFDNGVTDTFWYADKAGTPFTVHGTAGSTADLLLLHALNPLASRVETVDVVPQTATTTTLKVTGATVAGTRQKLVATVSPSAAPGTVTFTDGTATLGTAKVFRGTATLETALKVGAHQVVATFAPSTPDFGPSASAAVRVEIRKAPTAIRVLAPAVVTDKVKAPMLVTLASTVAPTGTVEVREGGKVLTSAKVQTFWGTGAAYLTLPKLTAGKHTLTVTYVGTGQAAGTSTTQVIKVVHAPRS
jgi:subtilisin family serine protease